MSSLIYGIMKRADIQEYEKLHSHLMTMKNQFEMLSKKNPDGVVNSFKIGLVNKLLTDTTKLIGAYKPFPDFEKFDDNPKVFNSDVLMMVAHYLTAVGRYKKANITITESPLNNDWMNSIEKWNTED